MTIGSPINVSVQNNTMRKGEAQYITIDIDPYYTLQSITSSDPDVLEVTQDNAWNYIASPKATDAPSFKQPPSVSMEQQNP